MKPKMYCKLYIHFVLLLILQNVLTYDLRDSLACSSFYREDLNLTTYSSNSSYNRFLLVDAASAKLFIGSMNKVTIVDLDNISSVKQIIELRPDEDKLNYCTFQKPEVPNCQNHVGFITKTKDKEYFLCGTNALRPTGYKLTENSNSLEKTVLGEVACSDDPFSNFTAIYVKSGNRNNEELMYYGARRFDRSTIFRPIKSQDGTVNDHMQGVFSKKWMKNPQFAGSFSVGNQVFFFFREIAVETEFIEDKIYSRIGKVCKKDRGGDSLLRNKWTSYQKARLNCSLPGAFPTYFDVIQDVVSADDETFYGLFTTNANGLPASAICAFEKAEIERVLNGPFKTQRDDMTIWSEAKNVPTPRPGKCTNDSLTIDDTVLGFIVDHPLMHETVQHKYGKPVFYLPGEELQQLEMEAFPQNEKNSFVFYAGSNRGQVYKILSRDMGQEFKTYLSNVYKPFEQTEVIWSLKQHGQYVYLGTDKAVTQINVQMGCSDHTFVDSCVYDPDCVWNIQKGSCQVYQSSIDMNHYLNFEKYYPSEDFPYENGTKREFSTIKMELNNKNFCGQGKNIVWKKRRKNGTFEKIKLDGYHFLDNKNSLIIYNITMEDAGDYHAVDEEKVEMLAAKHTVVVHSEANLKVVYKAKFDEWCEYFEKGKEIQDTYTKRCNIPGI